MRGQLRLRSWTQMAGRQKGAKLKRQSCQTRGGERSLLTALTTVQLCRKPLHRTTTEVRRDTGTSKPSMDIYFNEKK